MPYTEVGLGQLKIGKRLSVTGVPSEHLMQLSVRVRRIFATMVLDWI